MPSKLVKKKSLKMLNKGQRIKADLDMLEPGLTYLELKI